MYFVLLLVGKVLEINSNLQTVTISLEPVKLCDQEFVDLCNFTAMLFCLAFQFQATNTEVIKQYILDFRLIRDAIT